MDDARRAEAVVSRSGSSELDAATMNAARRLAARTGVLASMRAVASAAQLTGMSINELLTPRAAAQQRALLHTGKENFTHTEAPPRPGLPGARDPLVRAAEAAFGVSL